MIRIFFCMSGLTGNEFDCVYELITDCIKKDKKLIDLNNKLLDCQSELLFILTIARHAIDLGIMFKLAG